MNIWAIVPVKPLNRSKSRLAPALSGEEREELSRTLLKKTLSTLKSVPDINGVLVVSRDPAALALVRQHDVHTVQESGAPELNPALTRATNVVKAWDAQAVLIAASDIPFMTGEDISQMIALAYSPMTVVIAPDRRDEGTNAMLLRPPGVIPFRYGVGSFARHVSETKKAGADLQVYRSPTMGLDVDIPEDLALYHAQLAARTAGEHDRLTGQPITY